MALAEAVRACLKGEATSKTYEDIGTLLPLLADPADSASECSLLVGEANILQQVRVWPMSNFNDDLHYDLIILIDVCYGISFMIITQRVIMSLKSERVKKFTQKAGRMIVRLVRSKFEIPQMFEVR